MGALPLAWSAALRVNHDIIIQASVEYVVLFLLFCFRLHSFLELDAVVSTLRRWILADSNIAITMSGYWSSLWLRSDFAHKPLKNCVDIIHLDIVEIWNINDKKKV